MRLSITTSYPRFETYLKWPDMDVQQEFGGFNIKYSFPKVIIDQKEAMRELGLEDLTYMIERLADAGQRAALSGIARIAQEGDRMMDGMTTGENTIPILAREKMFDDIPEINVDSSPKTRPKIDMNYEMEINWYKSKVDINFEIYPPRIKWILGKVDISVVRGSKLDVKG